jgi:hypothetical protein
LRTRNDDETKKFIIETKDPPKEKKKQKKGASAGDKAILRHTYNIGKILVRITGLLGFPFLQLCIFFLHRNNNMHYYPPSSVLFCSVLFCSLSLPPVCRTLRLMISESHRSRIPFRPLLLLLTVPHLFFTATTAAALVFFLPAMQQSW